MKDLRVVLAALASVLNLALPAVERHELVAHPVSTPVKGHENIEWSTSYAFHMADEKKDLPRVLLVGDSICNGYQAPVRKLLEGKVNVSYWVSSFCVTSDIYFDELALQLKRGKFDVVHFNNGLHTSPKRTTVSEYEAMMEKALRFVRERLPQAKLIWASSTPLRKDESGWVPQLNAAGARVAAKVPGVTTNDLFALMDPMDRGENWADKYHYKAPAVQKQAAQVAARILEALGKGGGDEGRL